MYGRPKISVIIPVYNVAAYLPACLQSVCGQAFSSFEVLAVNDGSTDECAAVLARFKTRYPHLICLEQPHTGLAAARQTGLLRAEGEYVCFIDGDDFISPSYLEELYRAAQACGADLALAQTARYFDSARTEYENAPVFRQGVLKGAARVRALGGFSECMSMCGKLLRTDYARALDFPHVPAQEDIYPSVQAVAGASCVAPAPKAVYFYRQGRPGSLSARQEDKFIRTWTAFEAAASFLRRKQLYTAAAPYFERVRWGVLFSHISVYGLTPQEWHFVKENNAAVYGVPSDALKGKLRVQMRLLKSALWGGFSYPALWARLRRIYGFFRKVF